MIQKLAMEIPLLRLVKQIKRKHAILQLKVDFLETDIIAVLHWILLQIPFILFLLID